MTQGTEYPPPPALKKELVAVVREVIGPIATPDVIHWAPGLPKTRSGKIMRRILRKIASKYASGHFRRLLGCQDKQSTPHPP